LQSKGKQKSMMLRESNVFFGDSLVKIKIGGGLRGRKSWRPVEIRTHVRFLYCNKTEDQQRVRTVGALGKVSLPCSLTPLLFRIGLARNPRLGHGCRRRLLSATRRPGRSLDEVKQSNFVFINRRAGSLRGQID
jgi:hypothetical protein